MEIQFGEMQLKYRHAKTYSGLPFDLAKSALQKYIRRGNIEMTARIMIDISLIHLAVDNPESYVSYMMKKGHKGYKTKNITTVGKSMITNIKNRLHVIASEDISVANHYAAKMVCDNYDSRNLIQLVKLVVYLARSQKLRLISDYKTIFQLPPYYWKESDRLKHQKIHNYISDIFPFIQYRKTSWQKELANHNIHAFFYNLGQDMLSNGIHYVLNSLKNKLSESRNSIIQCLVNNYKNISHKEKPIYLYQAALVSMNYGTMKQEIDISDITDDWILKIKGEILAGHKYEVDDFCRDIHTKSGSKSSLQQFALEGAYVTNQNSKYYEWNSRLIYIIYKLLVDKGEPDLQKIKNLEFIIDIIPETISVNLLSTDGVFQDVNIYHFISDYYHITPQQAFLFLNRDLTVCQPQYESEYFDIISRAQICTSKNKSDVYFATMKRKFKCWNKGDRVVVKGPYKDNDCLYAIAMSKWKKQLGLPYIENMETIELIPDLWLDTRGIGIRYNYIKPSSPYFFMISDDLLVDVSPLPTKIKEATKMWQPTQVIDFTHLSLSKYYWNMTHDWLWLSNKEKTRLICYHIIRNMSGIGDLADRNFLLIKGVLYGLDEDAPCKKYLSKPGVLLKKKRSLLITQWLQDDTNWSLVSNFISTIQDPPEPIKIINPVINKKEYIISLFTC
jgi:hypothetical protein